MQQAGVSASPLSLYSSVSRQNYQLFGSVLLLHPQRVVNYITVTRPLLSLHNSLHSRYSSSFSPAVPSYLFCASPAGCEESEGTPHMVVLVRAEVQTCFESCSKLIQNILLSLNKKHYILMCFSNVDR